MLFLDNSIDYEKPTYLFEINKNEYIAQPREKVWRIIDTDDAPITEFEFMKVLGIQVLGLSIDNLLDLYLEDSYLYYCNIFC